MYEYAARILRVVDGDTVDAEVDLGFDIRFRMKLRLLGINAPEMRTPEGPLAKLHLEELLAAPQPIASTASLYAPVTVRTVKDRQEKYGRYLATLLLVDGTEVNARMVVDGFAAVYLP